MLKAEDKRYLKSLAMKIDNKYQIGKNEITPTLIDSLDKGLLKKELIKVKMLNTVELSANEVAINLATALNAEIIQVVGHVITLYRHNKEKPVIKFPR